jgi:O-antigen ligase
MRAESEMPGVEKDPHLAWINFAAWFTMFSEGWKLPPSVLGDVRVGYFLIPPLLLSLGFFLKGVYLPRAFTAGFLVLIAASVFNIFQGKDQFPLLLKQIIGIYLNAVLFYMILKANDWDVRPLFKMYLAFCIPLGYFAIVQEVAFMLGIEPIYNLRWLFPEYGVAISGDVFLRARTIMPEPAYFGLAMTPAFFAAAHSLLDHKNRWLSPMNSLAVMGGVACSFSSIGYMGVGVCLILLMINLKKFRYLILICTVLPVLGIVAYNTVDDFRTRIDATLNYMDKSETLDDLNLSSFALFSNMHVAFMSFKENPLVGSGLGSHKVSYDRHIGQVVDLDKSKSLLNKEDANSLFFRLISETGLVGTALFFLFLFKFHISKGADPTDSMWVINNAIMAFLILRLIRFGHYFDLGFFLFFWMYFGTYLKTRPREAAEASKSDPAIPLATV